MKTSFAWTLAAGLLASPAALATDILVDASGLQSSITTIGQAMAHARPGDRLLVLPGNYPAFLFEVGVHVVGLGALPADVRIARVDLHVSEPTTDYDAALSNLTVGDGSPANAVAISGNEQPPGVVLIDGVVVEGGVFLGGGSDGFHLLVNDSAITPAAGQGFGGAAVHLGGSDGFSFEFVDSEVAGWDADPLGGVPAAVGLRLAGAVRGRLARTTVRGGAGAAGLPAGADAIDHFGAAVDVDLWMDGGCSVRGGDAFGVAPGGHGIDLAGQLARGDAGITGGAGSPAGLDLAPSLLVSALPIPLHLQVEPTRANAQGPTFDTTGDLVTFSVDALPGHGVLLLGFDLDLPLPAPAAPLPQFQPFIIWFGSTLAVEVPNAGIDFPGLVVYASGFARPPTGGKWLPTNTVSRRIDLLAVTP